MRRVIGMDIHRTFAEVVFWEEGRLRHHGQIDMTRSGLEGFGRSLEGDEKVVVEATGNVMSLVRALSPFVARMIIANPMQMNSTRPPPKASPSSSAPRPHDRGRPAYTRNPHLIDGRDPASG